MPFVPILRCYALPQRPSNWTSRMHIFLQQYGQAIRCLESRISPWFSEFENPVAPWGQASRRASFQPAPFWVQTRRMLCVMGSHTPDLHACACARCSCRVQLWILPRRAERPRNARHKASGLPRTRPSLQSPNTSPTTAPRVPSSCWENFHNAAKDNALSNRLLQNPNTAASPAVRAPSGCRHDVSELHG